MIISAEDNSLAELLGDWGHLEFAKLIHLLSETSRQEIRSAVGAVIAEAGMPDQYTYEFQILPKEGEQGGE